MKNKKKNKIFIIWNQLSQSKNDIKYYNKKLLLLPNTFSLK